MNSCSFTGNASNTGNKTESMSCLLNTPVATSIVRSNQQQNDPAGASGDVNGAAGVGQAGLFKFCNMSDKPAMESKGTPVDKSKSLDNAAGSFVLQSSYSTFEACF